MKNKKENQEHWSIEQYKEYKKKGNKKSKYGAVKTQIDGHTFDSKKESIRFEELKLMEKIGKIKDLKLQPKFELQASFIKNGKLYRSINYIADFSYFDVNKGITIVEDVKSIVTKTKVYELKKKLFEKKYPNLTITEII